MVNDDVQPRRLGAVLTVLLVPYFMSVFDVYVVNVALPTIRRDLNAGPLILELVVSGFAFTYAAALVTGGRLGDLRGHRTVFVVGVAAFTVASLLCGIAPTGELLVVFRLIQGLTAALMVPQVLAMITAVFPEERRSWAVAWVGVASGLAAAAGQVLGGFLVDADILGLSWRSIFLINIPIGLVGTTFAIWLLPRTVTRPRRLDLVGAGGVAATVGLVLLPLSLGGTNGWSPWLVACLVAAFPAGIATWLYQRRLTARNGDPVLDLTLFRVRSYLAGVAAIAAWFATMTGILLTYSLLLQSGLGHSALYTGLAMLPMALTYSVTSLTGNRLVARFGSNVIVAGCAVVALSLIVFWLGLDTAPGGRIGLADVLVALFLYGAGAGCILPRLLVLSMTQVKPGQAGIGSGMLNTGQQFAAALGAAGFGAAFFATAGHVPSVSGDARGMQIALIIAIVLVAVVAALVLFISKQSVGRERLR
ncbi:MFS transporter [Streptomyces sioyaensis]|uniref:MFS transporter n=1 Tax=Streptomyces sioyaensis TaxID=67364 RepID=UPI0037D34EDC